MAGRAPRRDDFNRITQHVRIGVELLAPLGFHPDVVDFVHTITNIGMGAATPPPRRRRDTTGRRILCTAETFVALMSPRPFRSAMSTEATLEYLTAHSGGLLDPALYETLVLAVRESHILGLSR